MDMPSFKDVLQKLSVFKNNLSLLIPVVIGVIAVLLFIPAQLMSSKLKANVEQESIAKGGGRIRRLAGRAVSRERWKKEAERQQAHADDANEIAGWAKQSTQRELLSYDIFPEPDPNGFSQLIFQQFGQRFRGGIDELIARANGRDCPTDAELERGLEDSSARSRMRMGMGPMSMRPMGMPSMSPLGGLSRSAFSSSRMMGGVDAMIIDEICRERAASGSVYVNPVDLGGYEFWGEYEYTGIDEAVEDCWHYQLGYWVVEDIFDTVNAMNSGHGSILTAPVKRVLRVSYTMGLQRPGAGGGVFRGIRGRSAQQRRDEGDRPAYVITAAEGLTETCTGRYTYEDIDVIHFNVAVVISTKAFLPFLQQLCSAKEHKFNGFFGEFEQPQTFKHNQMTVLETKFKSIDEKDLAHGLYCYGDDPVVELDLICEYTFNKEGYDEIKPESVKKTLAGEGQTNP